MRLLLAGLLAGFLLAGPAPNVSAHDATPTMNRVSFQVESTRDVENDQVTSILTTTAEDTDPARLADGINKTMAWALETAKGAEGITVRSGGYRTQPVHDKTRIVRWRGSQELILESGDVEKISQLIGTLQSKLQVQSVRFSVSPRLRRAVEDELISEALAAYKARARIVRTNLDAGNSKLVQLSVNTSGGGPVPYRAARGMAMSAEVATPAFESGTSRVGVSVNATIELE